WVLFSPAWPEPAGPFVDFIPDASFWRKPPSRPRASARSRASASGPRESQRATATFPADPPAFKNRPTPAPAAMTAQASSFHWPDEREQFARLRISRPMSADGVLR